MRVKKASTKQKSLRLTSLLLSLCMIVSLLPVSIFAAGEGKVVDAAVIFSDLHTSKSDYKESPLKGIMTAIKNAGLPVSSVTSAGDAFSVNADNDRSNGKYTGYTSTLTGYIRDVLGNVPVNYVWSDHDRYAVQADGTTLLSKKSGLVYGAGVDGEYGTEDDGNYYVFSLSMGDLCSYDRYSAGFNYTQSSNNRESKGFTATVDEAIENFKADAAKLNKDRPLFITSHQPLYDNRNDNAFAEDWFDAINEVATTMDVAFFYGHNHKYDTGNDYYYAKGSTMPVATADNWNWDYDVGEGYLPSMDLTSEKKVLNFTHMCAGYMDPSSTGSTSNTTRQGVAVVITIYEDEINYATYNAKGKYTGSYALDETVERKFAAPTLKSISVTAPDKVEYTVGDTLDTTGMVVTAAYSDGTTEPVTGYTVSDVDMATAGTKTVTVTYKELTAAFEIVVSEKAVEPAVNTVSCPGTYVDEDGKIQSNGDTITATALGLTGITAAWNEIDLSATLDDQAYSAYDVTLTGYTEGDITVTLDVGFAAASDMQLYYIVDGELVESTGFTTEASEYNSSKITFTANSGAFTVAVGNPAPGVEIPDDAELTDLIIEGPTKTKYFHKQDTSANGNVYLDIEGLVVTAEYSKDGVTYSEEIDWNEFDETIDGYALSFGDLTTFGEKTVTVSYGGKEAEFNVWVCRETFSLGDLSVKFDTEGVINMVVETLEATQEIITSLTDKLDSTKMVIYDITPTYANGDTELTGSATVTLPIPYGVTNPAVYYVSDDGSEVERMSATIHEDGNKVVFITNHFSSYVVGEDLNRSAANGNLNSYVMEEGTAGEDNVTTENKGWVEIVEPIPGTNGTPETTTYKYVLDTDGVNTNTKYLIVNTSSNGDAYVLTNNNGTVGHTPVTISDGEIIVDDQTNIAWTFSGSTSGTVGNNNRYVYPNNGSLSLQTSGSNMTISNEGNGEYQIYRRQNKHSGYYYWVEYDNGWTGARSYQSSARGSVYLFAYDSPITTPGTEATDGTPGTYGKIDGDLTCEVANGTNAQQAMDSLKAQVDGYYVEAMSTPGSDVTEIKVGDGDLNWEWVDTYDGTTPGDYKVKISYTHEGKKYELGTAEVVVLPAGATYYIAEGNAMYRVEEGTTEATALTAVKNGITVSSASDTLGTGKREIDDSLVTWDWLDGYDGTPGTYNLKILYNDLSLGIVQVRVIAANGSEYPEYPNEGAVKVNKTATGIDFQASGVAQVEISASGVPIKKGADVIVMLDTSSSMNSNKVKDANGNNTSKTRLQVLQESLNNLIQDFKNGGPNGEDLDIRLAIADFNGYYDENTGTPYDQDENDYHGSASYDQDSKAKVYTSANGTLTANAFVDVDNVTSPTLGYTSGTNYDYGFDAIYQLGTAIKAQNAAAGEDRDLFVIFMSDGAAFQWNFYHSKNTQANWGKWITGQYTTRAQVESAVSCDTHYYYYDFVDHDNDGQLNEHRMANAIKGDPNKEGGYEIIRKTDSGLPEGTLTPVAGKENMYTVPGLGATMFTINFDAQTDGSVAQDDIKKSLASTASDQVGTTKYYYEVKTADDLDAAFVSIGAEIAYAAYNARFVDQMGGSFNLQLKTSTYTVVARDENGNPVDKDGDGENDVEPKTLAPVIEILNYDIYTKAEADASATDNITTDMIGDRKGTKSLLEVVKFSEDGSKAYSNLIDVDKDGKFGVTVNADGTYTISDPDDNILIDKVICASTFWYNTDAQGVEIDGVNIPTGVDEVNMTTGSTNVLPAETFYWKMGTVKTSELAIRYYVYLDGSMEGTKEAGSYATNKFATLYYDNYRGNPCYKETVSPVMAWKEANVSYAFYLVNADGEIIVNQTTGETGSFANKVAVTRPVVYKTVLLNSAGENVRSIEVASAGKGVLPEGYTLYDYNGTNGATYTVTPNSDTTGSWKITSVKDVATTYVMQYDPDNASAYSNELNNTTVGDDYTHTIVWFAVLWTPQALPDAVVIDYGLPVDISVLANDMFGSKGKLVGIGPYSDNLNLDGYDPLATGVASGLSGITYPGTYGNAVADTTTGKVRYTPKNMTMSGYEKFAYAVKYEASSDHDGYYYDTITVIPATTIYYEDNFVKFTKYKADDTKVGTWGTAGTAISGATQGEDRPGKYSLTDANNIYGYDAVNKGMSTYSLGQARMVHVDANSYATAEFTFYGTGFDVISMTSNKTGVIAVQVKNAGDELVASKVVNTYYGYTYNETDGTWVATPDENKALYQVPVLQIEKLPYGQYSVKITATYAAALDKTTADGYDLYLDAIRIYDPANDGAADGSTDTTIEKAYLADGEAWPSYIELRNKIIDPDGDGTVNGSFDDVANTVLADKDIMEGLVFIDGNASVGDDRISYYVSYGPNNEVYLAEKQSVAFMLSDVTDADGNSIVNQIHIGIKSADGKTGSYTIKNIASKDYDKVNKGKAYNEKSFTVDTTTDMYYDLTAWKNDIIVITNTGTSGIISLTNIKSTYTENPNSTAVANEESGIDLASEADETTEVLSVNETTVYMTPEAAVLTLRALNTPVVEETPEEEVTPDEEIPEPEKPKPGKPEKPGKDKPTKPEKPGKPEKPDNPNKGPQNNSGNNKNNGKNNKWNDNRSNGRYF